MKDKQCRRTVGILAAAAGGMLAAAFLPVAAALADDVVGFVPDPVTFDPTQVTGFPPYIFPVEAVGAEDWSRFDFTTDTPVSVDFVSG